MAADLNITLNGTPVPVYLGENATLALLQATRAEAAADAAAASEAVALAAAGPNYADTAAGLAATSEGDTFAVEDGGIVTIYRHDSGPTATELRVLPTTAALASTDPAKGAALIGREGGGTVEDVIGGEYPLASYAVAYDGSDEVSKAQDAFDAALAAKGTVTGTGEVLVGSSGEAFPDFNGAAYDAGINVGHATTYSASDTLTVSAKASRLKIKNYDTNGDSTALVVKHIGEVKIGEGVSFDGNATNDSGVANAFVLAGCGRVILPPVLVLENYRTARVCGTPYRMADEVHIGDVNAKNCFGNASIFLGKPFGVRKIFHKGTIAIDGNDGAGQGGVTVDNDSLESGRDIGPSGVSASASGTTVTLTCPSHGRQVGDYIFVTGASPDQFNGMFEVASTPDANTITYEAVKEPSSSPATGSIKVRPAFGPIEICNLDRVTARNLSSDDTLFAVLISDGVANSWTNYIEAINLDEISVNTTLGAASYNQGFAHWPVTRYGAGSIYAERTYNALKIQVGRADVESVYFPNVGGKNLTYPVEIAAQNDPDTSEPVVGYADHGTIKHAEISVSCDGVWDGTDRGQCFVIGNSNFDPSNYLIEELDLTVPYYRNGTAKIGDILGAKHVRLHIGGAYGGFTRADFNLFSTATWCPTNGSLCIIGARTLVLTIDDLLELGGNGLSSGKAGDGLDLHAFDLIHVKGGILDGGTGNDQLTQALVRLKLPATVTDHDTLCRVIFENVTFRNAATGIRTTNPSGIGVGNGYTLELVNCTFENVTTPVNTPSRFVSIRCVGTTGWLNDQVYTVATIPVAATLVAKGTRTWVSDATATTFGTTVAGGGANTVPVVSNGTNWIIG